MAQKGGCGQGRGVGAWRLTMFVAVFLTLASPAQANEGMAELNVGGLTFVHAAEIALESEVLTISPTSVNVDYLFRNLTPSSVTAQLAFPLPDLDLSDPDLNLAIPAPDPVNFVGFTTKIDGAPTKFEGVQRAMLSGKDVTSAVRSAGLPIMLVTDAQAQIGRLPEKTRSQLVEAGLLTPAGSNAQGKPFFGPSWSVATIFVHNQIFLPGTPVRVELSYRTSLGGSFDSILRKPLRFEAEYASEVQRYRKNFCVDDAFLRGLDNLAGADIENKGGVQERRLRYVLKTAANRSGPIKSFKLIIDKGAPDRLVSFCFPGVRKTSPTQFEAEVTDFTPQQDLAIILLGRRW